MRPGDLVESLVESRTPWQPVGPGLILEELPTTTRVDDDVKQFKVLFSSGVFILYEFSLRPLDETR